MTTDVKIPIVAVMRNPRTKQPEFLVVRFPNGQKASVARRKNLSREFANRPWSETQQAELVGYHLAGLPHWKIGRKMGRTDQACTVMLAKLRKRRPEWFTPSEEKHEQEQKS